MANKTIGGCVRTGLFAGGMRNYYHALIEIPLLVTTIVVGEFCHQHSVFYFLSKLYKGCVSKNKLPRSIYKRLFTHLFLLKD